MFSPQRERCVSLLKHAQISLVSPSFCKTCFANWNYQVSRSSSGQKKHCFQTVMVFLGFAILQVLNYKLLTFFSFVSHGSKDLKHSFWILPHSSTSCFLRLFFSRYHMQLSYHSTFWQIWPFLKDPQPSCTALHKCEPLWKTTWDPPCLTEDPHKSPKSSAFRKS